MPDLIKVFIVDDHLVIREGVTSILESNKDIKVVGQASNAQDTLSQISKVVPDIILMDLKMPGIDGIQLTRMVRNRLPACKVIMLTLYDQYVSDAVVAGAKGYLLKDITLEDLVDSIKRVYNGEEVYDKKIRHTINIDYEENLVEDKKELKGTGTIESSRHESSALFDQVKIFILPPTDISISLRLTSILEEALAGDFKQVEGAPLDGISITFKLYKSLAIEEINKRLSEIIGIEVLDYDKLAGINDLQKLVKEKQQFDVKHPSTKTIFVRT